MQRLTEKGYTYDSCDFMEDGTYIWANQLSAYEDTGLAPDEIPTVIEMCKIKMALDNIKEYQKIGTLEECRKAMEQKQECENCGYKIHSEAISKLHNCNDCGRKVGCAIAPRLGDYCRVNCYEWVPEPER